ncbi:hypothetical protein Dda_6251 [Drechslerella dactyloides]|uniref:WD40 repeat-like protein n=1 Tax=Drechslerella dactyloides TaxID=74499 RepID=A0AAD6IZG0_DREDA|nr:hypothetical protein Dda_6251 [Drechslerella dactyloides]
MEDASPPSYPRLVASTGDVYRASIADSHDREDAALNGTVGNGLEYGSVMGPKSNRPGSNVFRSVEWTADGTSLLAVSEDNCIRTFIAPPDLLTAPSLHSLLPYSICRLPSTPHCISPYPFAAISNPSTALFLTSLPSHPIQLRSFLYPAVTGTYPLIHTETEKYLTPASLAWTPNGTHFLAGTDSQIHLFDITREKDGPVESYNTGQKRKKAAIADGYSQSGVRGIVSALAMHAGTQMFAAGTYSRRVLLYSSPWQDGQLLDSINLNDIRNDTHSSSPYHYDASGNGVTSLSFSGNGTHLLIAERKSANLYIYDIRNLSTVHSILTRRHAQTNQKIQAAFTNLAGIPDTVVSGGIDGIVRAWNPFSSSQEDNDGRDDGVQMHTPSKGWKAAEDPVTAAAVHPTGCVVATSSGQRKKLPASTSGQNEYDTSDEESDSGDPGVWDNAIQIWAV